MFGLLRILKISDLDANGRVGPPHPSTERKYESQFKYI